MSLSLLIDQIADAVEMINSTSTPARRLVGGAVVAAARGRVLVCGAGGGHERWRCAKGGRDGGDGALRGAVREVEGDSGGVRARDCSGSIFFELQPGRGYRDRRSCGNWMVVRR